MNKVKDIFFLKVVDFFGNVNQTCFTVSPLFYNSQRKQLLELVAKNYGGKIWQGAVAYIGTSAFDCGTVWHLGTFRHYLITQDDLKNVKTVDYQEDYFNGFC